MYTAACFFYIICSHSHEKKAPFQDLVKKKLAKSEVTGWVDWASITMENTLAAISLSKHEARTNENWI